MKTQIITRQKTLTVLTDTHDKLVMLKIKTRAKSLNDVIARLINGKH